MTIGVDSSDGVKLRRVLSLSDLVFYGIVLIQPIGAVPLFGLVDKLSEGHVVTTILIAMVAMLITAISYGRLATVHPVAGSAYTYVGECLHPTLGFLTGWAMLLDYFVIPILNTIYGSVSLHRLFPQIPYSVWVIVFALLITWLNLLGIKSTTRTNNALLFVMYAVVIGFLVAAVRFIFHVDGLPGLFSSAPFYTPGNTSMRSIATATSLAALTYIGFDGVTTLSEEAINPRKDILRATVLVCIITGIVSALQVYLAQIVWPDFTSFPQAETAFMDVSRRVGGAGLFLAMGIILIMASVGSGLSGQAGAARLLYGMGRDNALPRKIFGHIGEKHSVPTYNIFLIGAVTLVGSLVLNFEKAAEVLNFGAYLAFMGVNLAAAKQFYLGQPQSASRRLGRDLLIPVFGFLFCLGIWWSLPTPAKLVGTGWFVLGAIYHAFMVRRSRRAGLLIRFEE
jgi:putrescine importer